METPDPPSDTPGASKQVVLTPHDIPRSLRVSINSCVDDAIEFVLWVEIAFGSEFNSQKYASIRTLRQLDRYHDASTAVVSLVAQMLESD